MEDPAGQDEGKCATTTAAGASNKLFLGGLSWTTTEDTIQQHFSKYGELIEVIVMRDRVTNKPRGFGFVTFKDQDAADRAFQEEHVLDGRTIDAKPSLPHGEHSSPKSKKIFVGGLAPETTSELFKQHFERFGKVVEAQIMVDHTSGRSRGFGFITFADEASVAAVFSEGSMQEINGKRVEVKAATPKGSGPMGPGPSLPGIAGRGMMYPYAGRGLLPGRYPGEYGWPVPHAYMPMPGYSTPYMPYGGYPGMIMGGMPMQYGVMGYPMQQQTVPGVVPGMQQQQQQQRQQQQSGSPYGYSIAQVAQRGGGGGNRADADAGSSRPAQSYVQPNREGASEGIQLPDNLNPAAGQARAGAAAYRAS